MVHLSLLTIFIYDDVSKSLWSYVMVSDDATKNDIIRTKKRSWTEALTVATQHPKC